MDVEYLKKVHCVNCGECGHVIKNCKGPITSFGIIIFKIVKDEQEEINNVPNEIKKYLKQDIYICPQRKKYPKIKFLMIQRKDTMSYIDFLRGKYPESEPEKTEMLNVQFSEMTGSERESLKTNNFDNLWENLWINKSSRLYKNEKAFSKDRFLKVDVNQYLETTHSSWVLQEFGFPKGRRNIKETNIACAEREFYEETGYEKHMYEFIKNYPIIEEEFVATNNITYKHKYYLVKLKDKYTNYIPESSQIQECEVRSVGWYSINECILLIRDYDITKKNILNNVCKDVEKMNLNYELSDFYYSKKNYPKY
jgi:8-oxo-dGTP pyrophosphatase MutT (NUDIX family)